MTDESEQGGYRIAHFFADYGAESEALSAYGSVTRFTIDPRPNPAIAETVTVDLMEETPTVSEPFDLGFFHPKCTRWSRMTNISGTPEDHENQIPRARELAESVCDHYVIENQPKAPLEDPTTFTGKMFGLPIHYERAFETSFPVNPQVRERGFRAECSPYFSSARSTEWWASVKGCSTRYPKNHIAKNTLPLIYVHTLLRHFIKAVNESDREQAPDNDAPPPRKIADDQTTLTEVK